VNLGRFSSIVATKVGDRGRFSPFPPNGTRVAMENAAPAPPMVLAAGVPHRPEARFLQREKSKFTQDEKMNLPQTHLKILLIGRGLRSVDQMLQTFEMISAELLFAESAAEGLELMCIEPPDVIVCDLRLADLSASQLCSALRSSERLSRIPVVFAGETQPGISTAFEALNAGADDVFTEHFSPDGFLAKLMWAIEQKHADAARRRQFDQLKAKHLQTIEIVRETSELFRTLADDGSIGQANSYGVMEQRIEFGMTMISGLTAVLEEQIRTIEEWLDPVRANRNDAPVQELALLS
jgi:response regulator RpfG family c-di-GMP phosphodiesterase